MEKKKSRNIIILLSIVIFILMIIIITLIVNKNNSIKEKIVEQGKNNTIIYKEQDNSNKEQQKDNNLCNYIYIAEKNVPNGGKSNSNSEFNIISDSKEESKTMINVKYKLYFYPNEKMSIEIFTNNNFDDFKTDNSIAGTYAYNSITNTLLLSYNFNGDMKSVNCSINDDKTIIHHPEYEVDFYKQ